MTKRVVFVCLLLAACSKEKPSATASSSAPTANPRASAAPPATSAQTAAASASAASAALDAPSASAAAAPPTTPKSPKSLADFLPASLEGTPLRHMNNMLLGGLPGGAAIGSYLDMTHRRAININLMPVQDVATVRAQLHGLKPGQTRKSPAAKLAMKAFAVKGFTVVRTEYLDSKKSEAEALLVDKVNVRLSVDPASDPDESVKLIKQLDLPGIAAFAKKKM